MLKNQPCSFGQWATYYLEELALTLVCFGSLLLIVSKVTGVPQGSIFAPLLFFKLSIDICACFMQTIPSFRNVFGQRIVLHYLLTKPKIGFGLG